MAVDETRRRPSAFPEQVSASIAQPGTAEARRDVDDRRGVDGIDTGPSAKAGVRSGQ
jgi:hypothetical protein